LKEDKNFLTQKIKEIDEESSKQIKKLKAQYNKEIESLRT